MTICVNKDHFHLDEKINKSDAIWMGVDHTLVKIKTKCLFNEWWMAHDCVYVNFFVYLEGLSKRWKIWKMIKTWLFLSNKWGKQWYFRIHKLRHDLSDRKC